MAWLYAEVNLQLIFHWFLVLVLVIFAGLISVLD